MAVREYKVKTKDTERLDSILKSFSEVKIIGDEENLTSEQTAEDIEKQKELKKRKYEKLAGQGSNLQDSIEDLISISKRDEGWREEEI